MVAVKCKHCGEFFDGRPGNVPERAGFGIGLFAAVLFLALGIFVQFGLGLILGAAIVVGYLPALIILFTTARGRGRI